MARPNKKPVSLDGALDDEAAIESLFHDDAGLAAAAPPAPAAKTSDFDKLTVYVPKAAAKRIKQMALDHDKRVNDFLQEGVDLMLAKHGEKPLKDWEKR
jgi:hypothetical protein